MDTHEIAHAAGFFDGDGCTSMSRDSSGFRVPRLTISQKDPRELTRFRAAVLGLGSIQKRRGRPLSDYNAVALQHAQGQEPAQPGRELGARVAGQAGVGRPVAARRDRPALAHRAQAQAGGPAQAAGVVGGECLNAPRVALGAVPNGRAASWAPLPASYPPQRAATSSKC